MSRERKIDVAPPKPTYEGRPRPPVDRNVDLEGYYMPLHIRTLQNSAEWAAARPDVKVGMLNLWMKAWEQRPAASLPHDADVLAKWADLPRDVFLANKATLLHKFTLCWDGRLYHEFLVGEARRCWEARLHGRNAINSRWKAKQQNRTALRKALEENADQVDTRVVLEKYNREGKGIEVGREGSLPAAATQHTPPVGEMGGAGGKRVRRPSGSAASTTPRSGRGERLPDGWRPSADVEERMRARYPGVDFAGELEAFGHHWAAEAGQRSRKSNWEAALWLWLRRAKPGAAVIDFAQQRRAAKMTAALGRPPTADELARGLNLGGV